MMRQNAKREKEIQRHIDRWADLMTRIQERPEILGRIPDNASLLAGEDDCIFINGQPMKYSDLVHVNENSLSP